MSLVEKQKNALKQVTCLLKDIEGELHFRSPYSSKLIDIRDMLEWLKDGNHAGCFKPLYDEGQENLNKQDVNQGGGVWAAPLECFLAQSELAAQIMLNLADYDCSELIYQPLICEAGKPFYFALSRSRCQGAFEAFVILFCHYLRYMEILDWKEIRPDNVDDLIGDKLIYTLAMCRESIVSDEVVVNETHWHTSVARDDILEHPDKPQVGIMHDGIKLDIDEGYEPPFYPLIHNALQLEPDNDNLLFFYETETEYVFFGS